MRTAPLVNALTSPIDAAACSGASAGDVTDARYNAPHGQPRGRPRRRRRRGHARRPGSQGIHPGARGRLDLLEAGVSLAQFEVMTALEREPGLHAGELARLLGVTRQAVHRLLTQLGREGLVDVLPRDHGVRSAHLTDAGYGRLRHGWAAAADALDALGAIPPETRNAAHRALAVCERALVPRPGWYLD